MARLSLELQEFFFEVVPARDPHNDQGLKVTLRDILELAGERTFGFLFVLLSFPSALPIPAPGYSTIFGVVLLLLSVQLVIGRARPWLPAAWSSKSFDLSSVQKVLTAGIPWLQRIEAISRPRLRYISTSHAGRVTIGVVITIMAISMLSPLPLTNTMPAMGIFVMGFGLLDDDGAIILGGFTIAVMALILSTVVHIAFFMGGMTLVEEVIQQIKGWQG